MKPFDSKTPGPVTTPPGEEDVIQKRAPTLYGIIVFKIGKGVLFTSLAIALYCLSDDDLPAQFRHFLNALRIQPDNRFCTALAAKIAKLTEIQMLKAAAGTMFYSLFAWVEGIGLMFRASWAGWLAIGESLFFIPIELRSLYQKFSWSITVILIINIVIVWYLYENRHRLFRHHHPHH